MKPIVGRYVKMFQELGIKTVMQARMRITKDDLRTYRIPLEQHNWKYATVAVRLIEDQNDKTSLKSEPSIHALSLHSFRQQQIDEINRRHRELPDSDPFKAAIATTRTAIEEQMIPLSEIVD